MLVDDLFISYAHDVKHYLLLVREFFYRTHHDDSINIGKLCTALEKATSRLTLQTNLILLANKESSGKLSIIKEPLCLEILVNDVLDELMPIITSSQIQIVRQLSNNSCPDILADPALFPYVVSNIIHNAVNYSPSGGTVSIKIEKAEQHLQLVVSDSGAGIPTNERDRIFEKYYRGSNINEKDVMGLGLYLAKKILEAHSGDILISDNIPNGTVFIVRMPDLTPMPPLC